MATMLPEDAHGAPRRVVLIDFDWEDADLVPLLLRDPRLDVRLVAGPAADHPGVRVGELCGLACTSDLADLTREIFDLALIGARSPRRERVTRLLAALGTPVAAPHEFLAGSPAVERRGANGHATPSAGNGAADLDARLDDVIPDLSDPAPAAKPPVSITGLDAQHDVPRLEESDALEPTLARWLEETGASAAELHVGPDGAVRRVCRCGAEDGLLHSLVDLALRLDSPQVVERVEGPLGGRIWAAWPLRAGRLRGVLAAAAIDRTARAVWERAVETLCRTREEDPAPAPRGGCISVREFEQRLMLAVERGRREGSRVSVHRLRFEGPPQCVERVCAALPARLRAGDALCRNGERELLLVCSGSPAAYAAVRRRLSAIWEEAWSYCALPEPAMPISDERMEMSGPEHANAFLETASRWIAHA